MTIRRLAMLSLAFLLVRIASAAVVGQPGYTDAYYYANVAARLAHGHGLTADFLWNPVELGTLPVVSHLFWMPMATVLQAIGIAALGDLIGEFRAGQAVIVAVAALLPAAAYAAARRLGGAERASLVAAIVVGCGGVFAPAWVSADGFAPAALLGTLFFLAYARAAEGSWRAGALAGSLVGLLYLTRAEGALFGLALLALAMGRASRAAGAMGAVVAIAIGAAWFARDLAAGMPPDTLARTAFLVRYDEFFALASPSLDRFDAALGDAVAAKAGALVTNLVTALFSVALVLAVPLAIGVRTSWHRSEVRAWAILATLVFAAQSLVWTLHSIRGSYFHSLAAFFPFAIAIAVVAGERLVMSRRPDLAVIAAAGSVVLVGAISVSAVVQWDATFNGGARVRAAALDAIPAGSFLAIDAAAWRWLSGRSVLVTPSDGVDAAACVMAFVDPHPTSLVLEEAHFRAYDALYSGGSRPDWLGAPTVRGAVKIFPVIGPPNVRCAVTLP